MHRIGIIPFDMKDDATAVLFVTSQTRGRWILPKGKAKPGERHAVVGIAEERARGKQLVERQRAVNDVAVDEAEAALQVEW